MSKASKYSDLCVECGVCCDGSFFELAIVNSSDLNEATRKLNMLKTGDKLQIKLPCNAHVNNRCTIYDQRPWVCRAYECKLLKEHKRNEVDRDVALNIIKGLKNGLNEMDLLLEDAGISKKLGGIHKRMRALEDKSSGKMTTTQYRKAYGSLLIKYQLLLQLLSQSFGVPINKKP